MITGNNGVERTVKKMRRSEKKFHLRMNDGNDENRRKRKTVPQPPLEFALEVRLLQEMDRRILEEVAV